MKENLGQSAFRERLLGQIYQNMQAYEKEKATMYEEWDPSDQIDIMRNYFQWKNKHEVLSAMSAEAFADRQSTDDTEWALAGIELAIKWCDEQGEVYTSTKKYGKLVKSQAALRERLHPSNSGAEKP